MASIISPSPHGLSVGRDGFVYTADSRDHTVRKWTSDGRLVLTLGSANQNAPAFSGKPFNRPTHATVASNGDIYVTDGYGNANIHCFSPEGELKFSWGVPGSGPGEFNTVHSVFIDHDDGDTLYVADRFNNRVQFFTPSGEFLGQWGDLLLPQSVRKGPDGAFYVAELAHRVTVLSRDGTVLARWGGGVEHRRFRDRRRCAGTSVGAVSESDDQGPGAQRPRSGALLRAARHCGRLRGQLLRRGVLGVMDRAGSRQSQHPEVRAPLIASAPTFAQRR